MSCVCMGGGGVPVEARKCVDPLMLELETLASLQVLWLLTTEPFLQFHVNAFVVSQIMYIFENKR